MLALLARVTGLAGARVIVDLIDTLAVVAAGLGPALVNVGLAGRPGPSRMADALVAEELVDTDPVEAGIAGAEVDLLVATFAGETGRAVAGEVGDQVGAVGAQQAGSLRAVVGVDLAALTLPSGQAVALVATLLQRDASRAVVAGITAGRARIYLQTCKK